MKDNQFELDMDAKELFERIAGLDQQEINTYYVDEQRQLNDWRKSLVEFAYQLAFTLNNYRLSDSVIKNKDDIRPMIEILDVLAEIPAKGFTRKVMIRHRGLTGGMEGALSNVDVSNDYVISVGDCMIDNQTLDYLIKSDIMDARELTRKLNRAFRFFSMINIYILEVYLGDWELRDKQLVDASLLHWARYFTRTKSKSNIIYDETSTPDPNLTILCALNSVKTEKFQEVVLKVHQTMTSQIHRERFANVHSIFDAIFQIEELRAKLVRPAIEINNNTYIKMWRQCFDKKGRFDRARFNQNLEVFSTWENTFYILWVDLKSVSNVEDRNTILNCIVRFIAGNPNLNEYIDYLLKDFFYYPLYVHFSDRNSLFVANILLFMESESLRYDFGRTPAEVLFTKALRNEELIERLRKKISSEWGDRFLDKMKTIKSDMSAVLDAKKPETQGPPFSFLINTLRELFIFLTITWGEGFHPVVRETVEEMANPQFEWYRSKNSSDHMSAMLHFFSLAMMCLLKLGKAKDVELFDIIADQEKEFSNLKNIMNADLGQHRIQAKKIIATARDAARKLKEETGSDPENPPENH